MGITTDIILFFSLLPLSRLSVLSPFRFTLI